MSEMNYDYGRFVWRECGTHDAPKALDFYQKMFGWQVQSMPMDSMGEGALYYMFTHNGEMIAGLYDISEWPELKDVPSHWLSYVSVADVDKSAAIASENKGQILAGPKDIPNVGRFAICADPAGAVLAFFKGNQGDKPLTRPDIGDFCWENLGTADLQTAKDFYAKTVGWQAKSWEETDLLFVNGELERATAGPIPAGTPAHWMTFVVVAEINAGTEKAQSLGANLIMPPMDIPVGKFSVISDPTGAIIALFEAGPGMK